MGKLQDREAKRKSAVAGLIGAEPEHRPVSADREPKKRISLSVRPSLYEDVQKIAYVQRKSVSEIVGELMEGYREQHPGDLEKYRRIKN